MRIQWWIKGNRTILLCILCINTMLRIVVTRISSSNSSPSSALLSCKGQFYLYLCRSVLPIFFCLPAALKYENTKNIHDKRKSANNCFPCLWRTVLWVISSSFLLVTLQTLVDLSLFQNCPPLVSILRLTSPIPYAHVLVSSSSDSRHLNLGFPVVNNFKKVNFYVVL